jgi:hypothetical protein
MSRDVRHIGLQARPILTIDDVVSYSKESHTMMVTVPAYERFMNVPVGAIFVVCAKDERVYYGTVWSDLYSSSVDGVVIVKKSSSKLPIIHIQLGYPSPKFFTGTDPRSDARIMRSLQDSRKLQDN